MIRLEFIYVRMFLQNNINTFDVLTFMQMRTALIDKKFISGNDNTHTTSNADFGQV